MGVLLEVCSCKNVGHLKVKLLLLKSHFIPLVMFSLTMLLKTHLTLCKIVKITPQSNTQILSWHLF